MSRVSARLANEFLSPKKFAFIGVSRDPKKFSRLAYKELTSKGFDIYPVNPLMEEVEGRACFHEVSGIPTGVDRALIMTPRQETARTVENAIARGFNFLWLQQGCETPEAIEIARQHDVKLVSNACVMMFAHPVKSVHGFHRFMARLFGQVSA